MASCLPVYQCIFCLVLQVVKLLEKEPENALQPNMVTSTSVTSSTQMNSASEETTVQQAADDGSGVKKTVTVQQETTQKVMTSTSEQVCVTSPHTQASNERTIYVKN